MSTSPRPGPGGYVLSGRYRVEHKLGAGSTGSVYLARDEVTECLVSLKILDRGHLGQDSIGALQEEFRSVASLRHPHVASVYDFGYTDLEDGRIPFYTREYIPGRPLGPGPPDLDGQADPGRFLQPILDVLDALDALHGHGALHLDIHAGNLIVPEDSDRGAVLIDSGLAAPRRNTLAMTDIPSQCRYPPELIENEATTPATDIYFVGRLLLYRLTGNYEGEGKLPREVPGWGPRLTLELERIVAKATDPRRELRFASALEFRSALARSLGDSSGHRSPVEPGGLTVGRHREFSRIDRALQAAASGESSVIWLHGPVGMGKSRLLTEARWRAQLRGLDVVAMRFLPGGSSSASLTKALGSTRGGSGGAGSWLAPFKRYQDQDGSTTERAGRAAEAYFATEGPPLAVLLDYLEHADRESRRLAEALVIESLRRSGPRESSRLPGRGLLVLVASSQRPPGRLVPAGVRNSRLRVGSLPASAARELLRQVFLPLSASPELLRRLAAEVQGSPQRIRRLALGLRRRYGPTGHLPSSAECSATELHEGGGLEAPAPSDPTHREVLRTLAAFDRAADAEEIVAASELSRLEVQRVLRHLRRTETVASSRRGRALLYYLPDPATVKTLRTDLSRSAVRRLNRRTAEYLETVPDPGSRQLESLARHRLAAGPRTRARDAVLSASDRLIQDGLLAAAARLLEDAAAMEAHWKWRFRFAERLSDLHGATGDHTEAIAALSPVHEQARKVLDITGRVRLHRRLGVHCHRSGQADRAIRLFHEALRLARARRDIEELVFIHSELAEIHTFRGEFPAAEEACSRGLELLRAAESAPGKFLEEMQVTLQATLGHLELRRQNPRRARDELEAARRGCRSGRTRGLRAIILNNLGIAYNQLDDLTHARRCFCQAERLLSGGAERSTLVQLACNQALIAAKLADADSAQRELDKASQLLRDHPGKRLHFFLAMARAVADHHLGNMHRAVESFDDALSRGREFGDSYLVRYGEVYQAEALLLCGDARRAHRILRASLGLARREGPDVLVRMAASRLCHVGRLVGLERDVRSAARVLGQTEPTDMRLLETWNDLFLAGVSWVELGTEPVSGAGEFGSSDPESPAPPGSGRSDTEPGHDLRQIEGRFRTLGIPAGARLSRLGRLARAVDARQTSLVRALVREIEDDERCRHRLLGIREPLALAGAALELGDLDRCDQKLREASAAMVGLPFLALDLEIETARACLAERRDDRESARHHLHRCLQTRELLLRSMPPAWRDPVLARRGFGVLARLESRLQAPERLCATPPRPGAGAYRGIVGQSPAMLRIFETIERIRDSDLPVLIVGDTGTGKELVARAIHDSSSRSDQRFYSLHCASLPPELFESELFGCEAGAFTGAEEARQGILEYLRGGTLLLDEITFLSPATQTKLLQVLDSRSVRPLGGLESRSIDVRFLASSSENVRTCLEQGGLRRDLYHRLGGLEIELPPLRARREDIPVLVGFFLDRHARLMGRSAPEISNRALFRLGDHPWPGNVRELESLVVRLLLDTDPRVTVSARSVDDLLSANDAVSHLFPDDLLDRRDLKDLREELERAYLLRLFRRTTGDIGEMTQTLGIRRARLYRWFQQLGIDIRKLRQDTDGH